MNHCKSVDLCAPLHLAAQRGDAVIVQILLDNGALLNARTVEGITPLFIAAQLGDAKLAK